MHLVQKETGWKTRSTAAKFFFEIVESSIVDTVVILCHVCFGLLGHNLRIISLPNDC